MITRIRTKFLLAYDENKNDHYIIPEGEIAYKDDEIIYIGEQYTGPIDRELDASKSLVSPGFIDLDALGDIDHTLLFFEHPKEKTYDLEWSYDYFTSERKEEMSLADESFKSLYAYVQLIRNGITTAMPITSVIYKKAGETYEEIEAAAKHAGELGLRVYLGPSFLAKKHVLNPEGDERKIYDLPDEEVKEGIKNARKFIEHYHNAYNGLIQACVVPERIELQTEDLLIKSKALAKEYKLMYRLHAAQGAFDYQMIQNKYGMSPIQYLDTIGLLDDQTLIPHCTYTSGTKYVNEKSNKDQEILKKNQTSIIHCPLVYARSGEALDSFGRFYREGVSITMGTDTFPCDPFIVMRTGQLAAKLLDNNRPENNLENFYHAFTIGGADALGRKDLGRLAVGAKADMIFINIDDFDLGVIDDPIQSLCLAGHGEMITTSIINGKVVMNNREIPGINLQDLEIQAQKYYEKMKHSYWKRSPARKDKTEKELFHQSYPIKNPYKSSNNE
ncbi:MAG: chlorohydrolase family protein [Tissierellia bacterium]|nr:chlorohydrolase family protein [Tissierellia bacterium]